MVPELDLLAIDWQLVLGGIACLASMGVLKAWQKKSKEKYLRCRKYLKTNRSQLSYIAAEKYQRYITENLPLVTGENWIPDEPVPLNKVVLTTSQDHWNTNGDSDEDVRYSTFYQLWYMPFVSCLRKAENYSEAIGALDKPKIFKNRKHFRLISVYINADVFRLTFGLSSYFKYIDTCEVLCYESAVKELAKGSWKLILNVLSKRRSLTPFSFDKMHSNAGINTLTLIRAGGALYFYMHTRSKNEIGSAMGQNHVVPAGEFQPASDNLTAKALDADFNILHNILREYAEEFLGMEEYEGKDGISIDYENDPPFDVFKEGLDSKRIRPFFLGLGIDPLSFKTEILTVCVFDEEIFRTIFKNNGSEYRLQSEIEFGKLIAEGKRELNGMLFNEDNVGIFHKGNTLPAGVACLKLAWKFRDQLMGKE